MVSEYFRHLAGFSRTARLFLVSQFFYGMGQTAVWVLRNLYLRQAGYREDFIGATLSASSVGMVLVVLTLTRFMDRLRIRGFSMAGAVLVAAGLTGVGLVSGETALLGFCFLSGVGISLLEVGTSPFLARHSEPGERPFLFGLSTALSPAAGLTATLALKGGALLWGENLASYRNMLFAASAATLLAIPVLLSMREREPEAPPAGGETFDWRTAAKFFLPEMAFGLGAGLTIPFINLYFRSRFGLQVGTIGLLYSAAQALMMVAFLAAPLLARRFGSVRTIVAFQLTSIPFFLVLALSGSLELAIAAFLLRHACMNMVHPVGAHFALEVVRPGQRARVNGLKQAANKTSWVVANALGGWIIVHAPFLKDGFTTTMFLTIGLYVIGSALYAAFFLKVPAGQAPAPEAEPSAGA